MDVEVFSRENFARLRLVRPATKMVGRLVEEQEIEPHVTVIGKSERKDGTFSRNDFTYDLEKDVYICLKASC